MGMARLLKEIEASGGRVGLQHVAVRKPNLDDSNWEVTLNYKVGERTRRVAASAATPMGARNRAADLVLADIAPEVQKED
jgi:hypothetical protein